MTQSNSLFHPYAERGAALVTSLVLLTVVTMLAITSMGTNTLEEKMAANSQEVNRAFQTAETGLQKVFEDSDAFNIVNLVDDNGTPYDPSDDIYDYEFSDNDVGPYSADTEYAAFFRQKTIPKRGSGWDTKAAFYHFDVVANGETESGASTILHAGAYQVGKR
ncbi:MAG: PilX N-terminal domain-containing pilus assembly protein [Proteobacteria bacterium]|nr:PilX N-terminal domain-containing pilus assembly protein [Pseudomonadota bacterium]